MTRISNLLQVKAILKLKAQPSKKTRTYKTEKKFRMLLRAAKAKIPGNLTQFTISMRCNF